MVASLSLPEYDDRHPAPYISVDVVILTVEDGVLKVLIEHWDDLGWTLPHEIAIADLALEEVAGRHVAHRLGLGAIELEQTGVSSTPGRDFRGRVVSVAFMGQVEAKSLRKALGPRDEYRLATARSNRADCTTTLCIGPHEIEPAFDVEAIVGRATRALRNKLDSSMFGFRLLPRMFTLLELRQIHEAIAGHKLNPVSFRKRMLSRVFPDGRELIDTGMVRTGPHRPATLYRLG